MWKATGSYHTYSIPGKATVLAPQFAVEDLLLAELQPRFLSLQWRTCPWAEHTDDDDDDDTLHYNTFIIIWGEGHLGFLDLWSGQKPWWNWYLTPVANFGEVRRAKLAKSTLLTSTLCPWNIFRSFSSASDTREREWCAENNGKLLHLFNPW